MSEETNNDEKTAANDEPQTSSTEENIKATLDEVNAEIKLSLWTKWMPRQLSRSSSRKQNS